MTKHARTNNRSKVVGVVVLLILSLSWVIYYSSTAFRGYGPVTQPKGPAWDAAANLNKLLKDNQKYLDVGVSPVSDSAMQFKVEGMIHQKADLDQLKSLLEGAQPDGQFEYLVVTP